MIQQILSYKLRIANKHFIIGGQGIKHSTDSWGGYPNSSILQNRQFRVSGTELVTQFNLQVYNRYGQLIFETADKTKGWDGNFKSVPASSGAYVYVLRYKKRGEEQVLRGSFLLVR